MWHCWLYSETYDTSLLYWPENWNTFNVKFSVRTLILFFANLRCCKVNLRTKEKLFSNNLIGRLITDVDFSVGRSVTLVDLSCSVCDCLSSFSLLPLSLISLFVCVCFDLTVCLFPVLYRDCILTEIWNNPLRPPILFWWRVLVTQSKVPVVDLIKIYKCGT